MKSDRDLKGSWSHPLAKRDPVDHLILVDPSLAEFLIMMVMQFDELSVLSLTT